MPRTIEREDAMIRAGLQTVAPYLRRYRANGSSVDRARAAYWLGRLVSIISPQTDTELQAKVDDLRVELLGK